MITIIGECLNSALSSKTNIIKKFRVSAVEHAVDIPDHLFHSLGRPVLCIAGYCLFDDNMLLLNTEREIKIENTRFNNSNTIETLIKMSSIPLTNKILVNIFRFLPFDDVILSVPLVCRQFYDVITKNRKYMQRPKFDHLIITPNWNIQLRTGSFGNYQFMSIDASILGCYCELTANGPFNRVMELARKLFEQNDNYTMRRGNAWSLKHRHTNVLNEFKTIFKYILSKFDIDTIHPGIFDSETTKVLGDCLQSANLSRKNAINKLSISACNLEFYIPDYLYQTMGCPVVFVAGYCSFNNNLLLLDTSRQIKIEETHIDDIEAIKILIQEWESGKRKIRQLTAHSSTGKGRNQIGQLIFFFTHHSNYILIRESDTEIRVRLTRKIDKKMLDFEYFADVQGKILCVQEWQ